MTGHDRCVCVLHFTAGTTSSIRASGEKRKREQQPIPAESGGQELEGSHNV